MISNMEEGFEVKGNLCTSFLNPKKKPSKIFFKSKCKISKAFFKIQNFLEECQKLFLFNRLPT